MGNTFVRPKINIKTTKSIQVIQAISTVLLIIIWISAFYIYQIAPSKVPMHFDLKGNIDRYDDKIYLFLLPAIATVLFWVLKYITTKPHIFNYPYEINEGNYKAAYKSATNMLHFLKLILLIVFTVVQYITYSDITNQHLKFSIWFLIIPLGALTIVPIFMALKSARKK